MTLNNFADSLLHINVVVTPKPCTCSTCVRSFFLVYVCICVYVWEWILHTLEVWLLSFYESNTPPIVILKQLHTKYCIIIKQYLLFPLSFSSAVYCCAPVSLRSGRRWTDVHPFSTFSSFYSPSSAWWVSIHLLLSSTLFLLLPLCLVS